MGGDINLAMTQAAGCSLLKKWNMSNQCVPQSNMFEQ